MFERCDWFLFCFSLAKNLREIFKAITMRSNRNSEITLDSHLKAALKVNSRKRELFDVVNLTLIALFHSKLSCFISRPTRQVLRN